MATKTYADRAKSIMNKYKKRLGDNFDKGDSLALEAMNQELSALQQEQEEAREIEMMKNPPVTVAGLPTADIGGLLSNFAMNIMPSIKNKMFGGIPTGPTSSPSDRPGFLKRMFAPTAEGSDFSSRVPWLGMASGIAGNMLMNKELDLPTYKHETYVPTKATANLVDFGREREQVMNERDLATNTLMGAARGTGSQAGLMENLQAGITGTQRVAGEQFGKSLENEGNINADIKNRTSQFNAGLAANAAEINQRGNMYATQMDRENTMINAERRDARTQGILDSVTGYAKDRMAADQYDQMTRMMTPENHKGVTGKDSWLRRLMGVSPEYKMVLSGTDTLGTKEKGGQLSTISLFGDDEYERIMLRANNFKKKNNGKS